MKQFFTLTITFFIAIVFQNAFAQNDFSNSWFDYERDYHKIKIVKEGVYRISKSTLEANGILTNGAAYKMYTDGKEIPIYVSKNTTFENDDYIEFYAKELDGNFDTQLFKDPEDQLHTNMSLFTDTATYFLAIDVSQQNLRLKQTPNSLLEAPPAKNYFMHKAIYEGRNQFALGLGGRFSGASINYSDYEPGEGFVGLTFAVNASVAPNTLNVEIPTPNLYASGPNASIEYKLVGGSDDFTIQDDHTVKVTVSDREIELTKYEGYGVLKSIKNLDLSYINAPATTVNFTALGFASRVDRNTLSYVYITYPRNFDLTGYNQFKMNVDASGAINDLIEIQNFETGGQPPILLDLANGIRMESIVNNNTISYNLPAANNLNRNIFIYQNTSDNINEITTLEKRRFIDFSKPENEANYIIISKDEFIESGNVQDYADYRASIGGGNHKTIAVDVELLYDQFAHGIRKHPLAIKNFVSYAATTWTLEVKNLFLIGKSIKNSKCRLNPVNWTKNLVPTYGDTPSDMQFGILKGDHLPKVAVGRLSASSSAQIAAYLNKVKEYEGVDFNTCDVNSLDWKKHVLHIAGGNNKAQQDEFAVYLNNYAKIIGDSLYGATAYNLFKENDTPIEKPPKERMEELINDVGLGLICFFGHSSNLVWEVDMGLAKDYYNKGKYPFIIANSCFVGDIHKSFADEERISMSEDWVLEADAGAIGYLAAVQFGFPAFLDIYTESIYEQISYKNYNKSIGSHMVNTINNTYVEGGKGITITAEEMVLQGDPAVILNYTPKPEFEIADNDISFEPSVISTRLDSFKLNINISNLGTFKNDELVTVCIDRKYPDGIVKSIIKKPIKLSNYENIYSLNIYTDPITGFGTNEITVYLDCDNEISELCEINNSATTELFITSDNIIPVAPCNYGIVNQPEVTLKATTGDPFAASNQFVFQIDTTTLFNSNLLETDTITSSGGVLQWAPPVNFANENLNGVVYYWRIGTTTQNVAEFRTSSFIYNKDLKEGWNQSHYYQYLSGTKSDDMSIDSLQRSFEYSGNVNSIKASAGYLGGEGGLDPAYGWADVYVDINNVRDVTWSCLGEGSCNGLFDGGIQFVILDPVTFRPRLSFISAVNIADLEDPECFVNSTGVSSSVCCDRKSKAQYKNIHCRSADTPAFDFETKTQEDLNNISNFIDAIPEGFYVLVKSIQNHGMEERDNFLSFQNRIYTRLEEMGIQSLRNIKQNVPFLGFTKKGDRNFDPIVKIGTSISDVLSFDQNIESNWVEGSFESTLIGPASEWETLFLDVYSLENAGISTDEFNLNVYGVKPNGAEELLLTTTEAVTVLSSIPQLNALFYPYLRLELVSSDFVNNTPPQLNFWRVNYEGVTELSFNLNSGFAFNNITDLSTFDANSNTPLDTLKGGQIYDISLAIENLSGVNADSVLLVYELRDVNNIGYDIGTALQSPIAAGEMITSNGSFEVPQLSGIHYLYINLNPLANNPYYQIEKLGFNNILIIPLYIEGDATNPLLDVTFDGEHILNGDLIAAEPEIVIEIRDDNPNLALTDTTIANIIFIYPDGTEQEVSFNNNEFVTFIPADPDKLSEENLAQIIINEQFLQNGIYQMIVKASDQSGNLAGSLDYTITFEINNEAAISHIYNYPNPFTSSTQFLFTLSGAKVPDVFKIQILTVTGKIIREIDKTEIGNLAIGRNITDYKWDGTDQYGNILGNGVYLFRVIASNQGEALEYYNIYSELNGSTDTEEAYHKSGFGKLYIMR